MCTQIKTTSISLHIQVSRISLFVFLVVIGLVIKLCVLIEARNRLNVFPSSLLNEISDELVLDRIENELVYKTTNNEERPRDLDEIMRELADFDQIAVDTATETIYVGARFVHVYFIYYRLLLYMLYCYILFLGIIWSSCLIRQVD